MEKKNKEAAGEGEGRFSTIKRKLELMRYQEPLDQLSVPLAEHLVGDLVNTTQSYRNLKVQHSQAVQELGEASGKISALSKEHQRVLLENNVLHYEQIKSAEALDKVERDLYQKLKKQEQDISDFQFWKHKHTETEEKLARENNVLRQRLERLRPGAGKTTSKDLKSASPEVSGTEASSQQKQQENEELKKELEASQKKVEAFGGQIVHLNVQIENREKEITRLSAMVQDNTKVDSLAMLRDKEHDHALITQLNSQLDTCKRRLQEYEEVRSAYSDVEDDKFELLTKLEDLMDQNKTLETELSEQAAMQASNPSFSSSFQQQDEFERKVVLHESEMKIVHEQLTNTKTENDRLSGELSLLRDQHEKLQGVFDEKSAAFESAKWRIGQLESEVQSTGTEAKSLSSENQALREAQANVDLLESRSAQLEEMNAKLTACLEHAQAQDHSHANEASRASELAEQRGSELKDAIAAKAVLEGRLAESLRRCEALETDIEARQGEGVEYRKEVKKASAEHARLEILTTNLQSEVDGLKSMNRALASQVTALSDEKKGKAAALESVVAEHNALQESTGARVAQMQQELNLFRRTDSEQAQKIRDLERRVSEATSESQELMQQKQHFSRLKEQLERDISMLESQGSILTKEKGSLNDKVALLKEDLKVSESHLTGLRSELQQLQQQNAELRTALQDKAHDLSASEATNVDLEEKVGDLRRQLERHREELDDAQKIVLATSSQEVETQHRVTLEHANASKYKSMYEKAKADLRVLKEDILSGQAQIERRQEDLSHIEQLAADRLEENSQLKNLIGQLDATQNKLVGKLRQTVGELEEVKRGRTKVEEACTAGDEARQEMELEVGHLKRLMHELDADKDRIQHELDAKCEEIGRLERDAEAQASGLHAAGIELTNSQAKLREMERALENARSDHESSLHQNKKMYEDNQILREQVTSARREIHALTDDMTQMAREQQVVNADLVKSVGRRNEVQDELKIVRKKATELESVVEMKSREMKEYTIAYQELGAENKRLQAKMAQLDREILEKAAEVSARDTEIASLEGILSGLESENRQCVSDMTSYEAVASDLTSALSTAETQLDRESKVKLSLIEKVELAKRNSSQLEAVRNNLQGQLQHSQVYASKVSEQLDGLTQENSFLREQFAAQEANRAELEAIINDLRSNEFVARTMHNINSQQEQQQGVELGADSEKYEEVVLELHRVREELQRKEKMLEDAQQQSSSETTIPAHMPSPGVKEMSDEVEMLRMDNERLLELLAKAESDCTDLMENNSDMAMQNKELQDAVTSLSAAANATSGASGSSSARSSPSKSPQRGKLQEQLQALKEENLRLRSNLEVTQATVGKMGSEINKLRTEYHSVAEEFGGSLRSTPEK